MSQHTPQNSYNKEELLASGRGEIFGAGNAQLPLPNMLMMDRIIRITDDGGKYGKGEIIAELDIHPDLWFFACHFQGDPVMPGCLGLDAMWQLVGFFLAWKGGAGRGRALGCGEVKFTGQVLPTHNAPTGARYRRRHHVRGRQSHLPRHRPQSRPLYQHRPILTGEPDHARHALCDHPAR